jgi:CHAT domain-containing protein
VYTETGDYQEAERLLSDARRKAESLIEKSRRDTELGEISLLFGDLESKQKDHNRAVKYYGECVDLLEGSDNTLTLYNAKKSRLLAYQALGDNEQVEKDLAATLKLTEDYREKITDEQDRNKFFSYEQEVYDAAVEHEFRRGRAEQAFNYNETSNSRSLLDLMKKKSQAFEPAGPLPLNEIRERMPANVQILEYSVLKDKVLTWVVTKEKVSVVSTPFGVEELTGKIKNYLSLIRAHDSRQREQLDQGSKEFYRLLIEPALPHLEREREICIIPNKILFQLPFASLLSPAEKYFLEEFSFFYSPSANIFVLSTEDAGKRNTSLNEALLSVGNPAFDRHKLPSLEDLRESAKEAGEIARNYQKPKLLLNEDATKERFKHALKNADVLHFAGHYIVNSERPLASELVMAKSSDNDADNFFTSYELKDEELPRTKLVILSACQTGVEGYYNGEGLIGLSRTFLSLGVPVIVASQWSVDSGSTAVLMKKFHKYRKQDKQSTVHALRNAQLDMLGSSDGEFHSPFFWAAFATFGAYAEF